MSITNLYRGLAFFHYGIIEKIRRETKKLQDGDCADIVLSFDLNKSSQKVKATLAAGQYIIRNRHKISFGHEESADEITISDKLIALLESTPEKIYAVDFITLEAVPLHFASEYGNVKLAATDDAPTMEIDGVKMHRSQGISPWDDSKCKARDIVKRGMSVLDTCTGLGYTAIIAAKMGARSVISFERNPAVLKTASYNPWSQDFFENTVIKSNLASVYDEIFKFEDSRFDAIIHDPPRFSLAGELYSADFYKEAHRVLRHGGKMFHYIGDPHSSFGKKHYAGINMRLREAGFDTVVYHKNYGIMCQKLSF
ncbi:MAG TPA: methyltransferase domain-containing protein [Candidatus Wallbacteria bacterium]|nr:methyltransferase domain-containing protein [Candidatus Wallbacteria bacterium]